MKKEEFKKGQSVVVTTKKQYPAFIQIYALLKLNILLII